MLAPRAAIERRRRELSFGVLMGSFFVLTVTLFYIDFVVNVVAPKVLHGDGGVALYIVVEAAVVAAPLVAAFTLGRYQPGVAFLVVLIALNVFALVVLASALISLARVIGSSFVTSLVTSLSGDACTERSDRTQTQGIENSSTVVASWGVIIISIFHIDFVVRVVSKLWHGYGGVGPYLGVGALVAAPLVAAFALVIYHPAGALLVGLEAFNLILVVVLVLAFGALSHAIGYLSIPPLLRYLSIACCFCSYNFQLYYFYGAYHSVTYIELENGINETDKEIDLRTPV